MSKKMNRNIMERGYIKIEENGDKQLVIMAKLVNCTLWMTKHEIAELFNVYVNTVGNNLRSIFKSGLLREQDVTYKHKSEEDGLKIEAVYYNLEVLVFLSYRINSFKTKLFREWMLKALFEYFKPEQKSFTNVHLIFDYDGKLPPIILN